MGGGEGVTPASAAAPQGCHFVLRARRGASRSPTLKLLPRHQGRPETHWKGRRMQTLRVRARVLEDAASVLTKNVGCRSISCNVCGFSIKVMLTSYSD